MVFFTDLHIPLTAFKSNKPDVLHSVAAPINHRESYASYALRS